MGKAVEGWSIASEGSFHSVKIQRAVRMDGPFSYPVAWIKHGRVGIAVRHSEVRYILCATLFICGIT